MTTCPEAKTLVVKRRSGVGEFIHYMVENWMLILLALPGVALIFVFRYIPLFGLVVAFQDFSPRTGFLSPWVGLSNFRLLWQSPVLGRLVRNTLLLNFMAIVATTFFSVTVALLLNEVRSRVFKSLTQSIMFLPFFMGWTLVAMVLYGLIDYQIGTINVYLARLGLERVSITARAEL
jgi:putative aldouronate transport system permease protein